jgi:hypothetical protein
VLKLLCAAKQLAASDGCCCCCKPLACQSITAQQTPGSRSPHQLVNGRRGKTRISLKCCDCLRRTSQTDTALLLDCCRNAHLPRLTLQSQLVAGGWGPALIKPRLAHCKHLLLVEHRQLRSPAAHKDSTAGSAAGMMRSFKQGELDGAEYVLKRHSSTKPLLNQQTGFWLGSVCCWRSSG